MRAEKHGDQILVELRRHRMLDASLAHPTTTSTTVQPRITGCEDFKVGRNHGRPLQTFGASNCLFSLYCVVEDAHMRLSLRANASYSVGEHLWIHCVLCVVLYLCTVRLFMPRCICMLKESISVHNTHNNNLLETHKSNHTEQAALSNFFTH